MPGKSMMFTARPSGQIRGPGVLLHRYSREIRYPLAESGKAIKQGGFAGIGSAHQRDRYF